MPNLPSSYRGPPPPLGRANSVGPGNYSRTSVPPSPPSYSRSNSSSVSAAVHTGITVLPLGLMRANSIGPSSQLRQRSSSPSPFRGVPIQQQQQQQLPLPLPPPPPPAPVPTAASASSKNQLNSGPSRITTSSLATTSSSSSFLKPYYGHSTEELLDKHSQGLLPILLYIRNFNEYRRHRPAEARLAARRAARAEAREIRLKEMERQQKEMDETSDRHYDLMNNGNGGGGPSAYDAYSVSTGGGVGLARMASLNNNARNTPTLLNRESRTGSYTSSRRSSQDSLDFAGNNNLADMARELKAQKNELEEKYRSAMILNDQLDNEKMSFVYQIDLFKDDLEEMEENYLRLTREHRDKSKTYDQLKRDYDRTRVDFEAYKAGLEERDRLIIDAGLVLIRNETDQKIRLCSQSVLNGDSSLMNGEGRLMNGNLEDVHEPEEEEEDNDHPNSTSSPRHPRHQLQLANNISLISKQAAAMLAEIPGETLEKKLAAILAQNQALQASVKAVSGELEEERARYGELSETLSSRSVHLTTEMEAEIQREANKMTNDLRYKLKKAEAENQALTASVARLDSQVTRYKAIAEEAEKEAEGQKSEKRRALRELREAQTRIEELESANSHLQKRIDKLKSSGRILLPGATGSAANSVPTTPVPGGSSKDIGARDGSVAPFPAMANNSANNGIHQNGGGGGVGGSSSSSEEPSSSSYCSSEASSTVASND